jgi:hypothetical protein
MNTYKQNHRLQQEIKLNGKVDTNTHNNKLDQSLMSPINENSEHKSIVNLK